MAGPPKRSNAHKKATHSRKMHSGEDITPELLSSVPKCPPDVGKDGAKEWKRVCALLIEQQVLTAWDLPSLKIMCMEYDRYILAIRDIQKNGAYQLAPSGYEQTRPIVAERDKGFANYARLLGKFGGDVVARARMKRVKPIEKEKNPFEEI